jgi:hypothetical protein
MLCGIELYHGRPVALSVVRNREARRDRAYVAAPLGCGRRDVNFKPAEREPGVAETETNGVGGAMSVAIEFALAPAAVIPHAACVVVKAGEMCLMGRDHGGQATAGLCGPG